MSVRDCAFTFWVRKCMYTILLAAVLQTIKTCDCKRDCHSYDYYQELERALISDNENLFKLQQMFFPVTTNYLVDPQDRLAFNVCTVVTNGQPFNDNSTSHSEKCWIFEYSSTVLNGLVSTAQLLAFEYITTVIMTETAISFHTHFLDYKELITLQIESFPCAAIDQEVYRSVATLTSWVRYVCVHLMQCLVLCE